MASQAERTTDEVVADMDRTTNQLQTLVDELRVLVKHELEEPPRDTTR